MYSNVDLDGLIRFLNFCIYICGYWKHYPYLYLHFNWTNIASSVFFKVWMWIWSKADMAKGLDGDTMQCFAYGQNFLNFCRTSVIFSIHKLIYVVIVYQSKCDSNCAVIVFVVSKFHLSHWWTSLENHPPQFSSCL